MKQSIKYFLLKLLIWAGLVWTIVNYARGETWFKYIDLVLAIVMFMLFEGVVIKEYDAKNKEKVESIIEV